MSLEAAVRGGAAIDAGHGLDAHVVVQRRGAPRVEMAVRAQPGEIVAVMGPSGAGKSTVLAAIAGLVRLSDGHVRVEGRTVSAASPRRHVAPAARETVLLGQEPRLFPHLSARENVAFGPRAQGTPRRQARRAADELLWRVGLPGAGDRRPGELSGGQQQRAALARALAVDPKVLLLDEPLTSLDAETAGEIRGVLAEQLTATRASTVIVTHDVVDAAALADRLVILESGHVAQQGPVREVLAAPATAFAAAVAGVNRVAGVARGGAWVAAADGREVVLTADDDRSRAAAAADGAPLVAFVRPSAIHVERADDETWTAALALARDDAPRAGEWVARVDRLEQTPAGVRVHTASPALAADVPAEAVAARGIATGRPVRLRIAATDVRLARTGDA